MELRLYRYKCRVKKLICFFSVLPIFAFSNPINTDSTSNQLDATRKRRLITTTAIVQTGALTGVFVGLNEAWYKQYPRTSFHVKKDFMCWQQIDKAGHAWTTYQYSRLFTGVWREVKLKRIPSMIIGTSTAILAQSTMESLDGFSEAWGFSWGDMTANTIGATTFAAQEAIWGEQRVTFKMGYMPEPYRESSLKERASELYGKSFNQKILKDYNAQTYWASFNLKSFARNSGIPSWLNVAVGYGASGMYGAMGNGWADATGTYHNREDIARLRHFYLAPDISLSRINTRHKWLKKVLFVADMIKIPAPTLEYTSEGKLLFKPFWL
ncbi:DUF2279 domain-containing protein [Pedobacter sp. SYSU D00535]|uniref:DUF2279 domain-containing protein n=1 Tax=Pedobacter sp. SYSU D00535 TaxID=2810308 RepID=UPI001A974D47|nr:DUF2279 domain-containing protein [Pedobacter sp. SYSU D00535]